MTNDVVESATPYEQGIGQRIRQIRERRGISQSDFAERMHARVKKGWTRQVVWQVEQGKKPLSPRELVHIANVLAVTVVDLISTSEPVEIDGVVLRVDELVSGRSAIPEVEGWARFDEAVSALRDCALAWARYQHAVDTVRNRVRESARLREDIARYALAARERARREIVDAFSFRPPADFDLDAYMRVNPTPDFTAAHDVLHDTSLPPYPWADSRLKPERKTR